MITAVHWCGCCQDFGDVFRAFTAHVTTMSERDKAELRKEMGQQFRQPPQPEPLLGSPTIGSTVTVQLLNGRKIQGVVKAIHNTTTGRKFQVTSGDITVRVEAKQILK